MIDEAGLVRTLGRKGVRVTAPRRRVAALVAAHEGPFSAADLVADAQASGTELGRATIFRAIDLFVSLGALERVDLPSGDHAYLACEPAHHHHVICTECGRTTEVEDCGMSEVAREVARRSGYRVDFHRLELFGTCPRCRRSPSDAGESDPRGRPGRLPRDGSDHATLESPRPRARGR